MQAHSPIETSHAMRARLTLITHGGHPERVSPARFDAFRISGADVCRLMRRHERTLHELAATHGLTLRRLRTWRARGLEGFSAINAVWCITGTWPA